MGIFAVAGRKIVSLVKPPKSFAVSKAETNGTPPPKLGPYRELQLEAINAVSSRVTLASLGIEMLPVPATGENGFTMGNTKRSYEQPIRQVKLSGFGLSRDPITKAQYRVYLEATEQTVSGENQAEDKADHPVVNVSWVDAVNYCEWLTNETGRKFRLPTEAEWEYAARGLDGREYPWGNEALDPTRANYRHEGSPRTTTPVGKYPAGAGPFGHLDLAGNVWEWCYDWYAHYVAKDLDNPIGPKNGESRVLRGGSWVNDFADDLRCANRLIIHPEFQITYTGGFRVAEDYFF
jgi:formylglycine-generating enzyme required for sulfatase activity